MKRFLPVLILASSLAAQDHSFVSSAFESAGREFGIPADVLKGIAFAETRWEHLQWAKGDTASCMGLPRAYGVMALRSDSWFGHSLEQAARLLGTDPDILKKDPLQNIRGAAAYLRSLYDAQPVPEGTVRGSFESWQNAIAAYCGIPQSELAQQHALEIYERLSKGYHDFGIRIEAKPVNLLPLRQSMERAWVGAQARITQLQKKAAQPDYPEARWASAYPGHWYTTGYARDFVVIHDMEGYYLSVISYFQQQSTSASAHYCTNGLQDSETDRPAGDITQMVEEQYWAWHAICWNRYSLGIEHEGFVSNPAWFTVEQYIASAKLTRYMCLKYGIPMDRNHIIGHNQKQDAGWLMWVDTVYKLTYPNFDGTCNTHTDPGVLWDWDFYMQIVKQDSTPPQVVSLPPTDTLEVFEKISITFDQRMNRQAAELAFKIDPAVPGVLTWSTDYRTLAFSPSIPYSYGTTYTVTVDTSAHNYLNIGLDVNNDGQAAGEEYSFTFVTVPVDTIRPSIISTYPQNNQGSISTTVEFIIRSNEPLLPGTFAGAFSLWTADSLLVDGNPSLQYTTEGYSTVVRIKPQLPLEGASAYRLSVSSQIQDYGGNAIDSLSISFVTGPEIDFPGTVLNAIENAGEWWQPSTSGSTTNVIASWTISSGLKKEGTGSGMLTYQFTQPTGGVIREYSPTTPIIDVGASMVGTWIYGDNSKNGLEYWFYYYTGDSTVNVSIKTGGTVNWTGWRLMALPVSLIPASTAPTMPYRKFAGFVIRQITGGSSSGLIYFDALTAADAVTDAKDLPHASIPTEFSLSQNYPNPFNPTTAIIYQLTTNSRVRLTVFDVLGREVAVLVNEEQRAGVHNITWNASSMPSGVYFYTLTTPEYRASKKMVLLK